MNIAILLLIGVMVSAPAAAEEALIRIDARDCARLVRHQPAGDVAYRPGVDVRGRAVAPADLGGGSHLAMGEITVAIEIDMARRYGVPTPSDRYDATAPIGIVTIRNGTVLFNGQPMSDFDQDVIAAACRGKGMR